MRGDLESLAQTGNLCYLRSLGWFYVDKSVEIYKLKGPNAHRVSIICVAICSWFMIFTEDSLRLETVSLDKHTGPKKITQIGNFLKKLTNSLIITTKSLSRLPLLSTTLKK